MRKRFTRQTTFEFTNYTVSEDIDKHNDVSEDEYSGNDGLLQADDKKYCTVSQVNEYIRQKINGDDILKGIMVKGEISNYTSHSSGHSYFILKDKDSQISTVLFRGFKQYLTFEPKEGMKVIITGDVDVYKKNGKYQLVAHKITEAGIGDLYIAYQQLKEKLAKEGLFDKEHKKKIVKYPKRIGVVTAKNGAAVRDIITTIKRRYPYCEVLVFSTLVQGDQAARQITYQIRRAQNYDLDTLIVGRGGGSIEDLWSFNEEIVAHAIYESQVPVISAVGYEIDYTISDFVADLRAPTPTAAAEMAVPDMVSIIFKFNQLADRITKNMEDRIIKNRSKLDDISKRNVFKNPHSIYDVKRMDLDLLVGRFENSSKDIISDKRNLLFKLENAHVLKKPESITKNKKERYVNNLSKLEVLNPLLTLKRGYAIAKVNDKVISSSKDVKRGDKLNIDFDDGTVYTKVI